MRILLILLAASSAAGVAAHAQERGEPWKRHTIDASSRGADGARLLDADGNGRLDIATGWEEGGLVRLYLNPGPQRATDAWPGVTVGQVKSPEDAVLVDLDGDGAVDVVSSCEGRTRTMYVHWAPQKRDRYLDPAAWRTEPIPATEQARAWMFCLPLQVDGRRGIDLVAGSKAPAAQIGWFESPENPRDLAQWKWHLIYEAGWVMSLFAVDVDGDGDLDVVTTDRKGPGRGCYWLENPGDDGDQRSVWPAHAIGGQGQEVMFMTPVDFDDDGLLDVVTAVHSGDLLYFRRTARNPPRWQTHPIAMPAETGGGKGVAAGDLDLDGTLDLVVSCEGAEGKSGVVWLSYDRSPTESRWSAHEISGQQEGIKFDLVQLLDLDNDGDLDVITCEERDNLGLLWYENPAR